MQCELHGCVLASDTSKLLIGSVLLCPACEINKQSVILRDLLGRCEELTTEEQPNSRLNLINNRLTTITIGDQYQHREHGTGTIKWINPDNKAKYPIKVYFEDKHVYCYFNIDGMQCETQKHSFIEFPKVPKPDMHKVVDTGVAAATATEALRSLGTAFRNSVFKKSLDKWDRRFITLASHIAQWSKDPSTQCGSVITDSNNRVISLGFNGFPRGIADTDLSNRELKYEKTLHGEVNSILYAKQDLTGCTIYVWPLFPCARCASVIVQSGVTRVVSIKPPADERTARWEPSNKIAMDMFTEVGVKVDLL